jgi:hypothetical protein
MAALTHGPVWAQGQEVLGEIRELQGCDRVTGTCLPGNKNYGTLGNYHDHAIGYYDNNTRYLRGEAYRTHMGPVIANLDAALAEIHSDAEPVRRTYSITLIEPGRPASPGQLRIVP